MNTPPRINKLLMTKSSYLVAVDSFCLLVSSMAMVLVLLVLVLWGFVVDIWFVGVSDDTYNSVGLVLSVCGGIVAEGDDGNMFGGVESGLDNDVVDGAVGDMDGALDDRVLINMLAMNKVIKMVDMIH
mmetsp:Transcript_8922/g.8022  ORF Transcript_8922/g.8022 Transcript_8922/m.8022 type:complete len:128 (+) Transcript_8922:70-453(+)